MAQHVNVVLVDDVDGSPADETVTFGLDGVTYEIDLTADNAERLREGLGEWVQHGRRVGGGRKRGTRGPAKQSTGAASTNGASNSEIREWARANGHEVSERGRIKTEIIDAYTAANG